MNHRDLEDAKVLLVDDQPANLDVLCDVLEAEGYGILFAPSGRIAIRSAIRSLPDLILMDVTMPEMDGFEACRLLKEDPRTAHIPVIFVTARDRDVDLATGFEAGGVDYITKPFQETEVLIRVETHVRLNRLARMLSEKNTELEEKNRALEEEMVQRKALKGQLTQISNREAERWGLEGFIGESPTIQKIYADVALMQEHDTGVLISGESGTGKELVARAIHFGGARQSAPFIPVNCGAIPSELVEAALFGHVRGAFTGAVEDRLGYFQMAHGGTLFLDEIGEMPLELQSKLLRVLEDGEVWPVGATEGKRLDVRVLAATNVNLHEKIETGAFRQDLFFRLARFTVTTPPLRECPDDIPVLARHFLSLFAVEMGRDVPRLKNEVVARLKTYHYPGNVRELKNMIERALIESRGANIDLSHLHFLTDKPATDGNDTKLTGPTLPMNLDEAAKMAELWVLEEAMKQTDGNLSEAARFLGVSRNRVYRIVNHIKT